MSTIIRDNLDQIEYLISTFGYSYEEAEATVTRLDRSLYD